MLLLIKIKEVYEMKMSKKNIVTVLCMAIMLILCCTTMVFAEDGSEAPTAALYGTFWSLLPPLIAIGLALITKEVYSSLFIGIVVGGVLYSIGSTEYGMFEGTFRHVLYDGIIGNLTASANVGILVFLVLLGVIVCLMNLTGGSAAFGRWAENHIHTRVGAQLATVVLGILIFVDDYFN